MTEVARWDHVYASEPHLYTHEPNVLLIEVTRDLPPGAALDVGMGEGH